MDMAWRLSLCGRREVGNKPDPFSLPDTLADRDCSVDGSEMRKVIRPLPGREIDTPSVWATWGGFCRGGVAG